MGPSEVDAISGRSSGNFYNYDVNDTPLIIGLLERGINVERIFSADTDMYEDYIGQDLSLSYEQYCARTIELFGEEQGTEWLGANMNIGQFAEALEQHLQSAQRIVDTVAQGNGNYSVTRDDITVELLQEKLKNRVVLCDIQHDKYYASHSVVLENIKYVGDKVFVRYFNPDSSCSEIKTELIDGLESFVNLDNDIRLLSL
jgi:hypothetical protein